MRAAAAAAAARRAAGAAQREEEEEEEEEKARETSIEFLLKFLNNKKLHPVQYSTVQYRHRVQ